MPTKQEIVDKQIREWKEEAWAILVTELCLRKNRGSDYYMAALRYEFNNLKAVRRRCKSMKKKAWNTHRFVSMKAINAFHKLTDKKATAKGLHGTEVMVYTDTITPEDESRAKFILSERLDTGYQFASYCIEYKNGAGKSNSITMTGNSLKHVEERFTTIYFALTFVNAKFVEFIY